MGNNKVKFLVQSSLLLATAIVFQIIGSRVPGINQYLVGSVVNAILLTTAFLCGNFYGTAVGVLTPLTALFIGQLKPAMAPFIPFIMIGNALLIISFGFLHKKGVLGKYIGIILGSVLKFTFLYFSAIKLIFVFKMNFPPRIAQALATAMGATQLVTALTGGIISLVLIKILSKKIKITDQKRSAL